MRKILLILMLLTGVSQAQVFHKADPTVINDRISFTKTGRIEYIDDGNLVFECSKDSIYLTLKNYPDSIGVKFLNHWVSSVYSQMEIDAFMRKQDSIYYGWLLKDMEGKEYIRKNPKPEGQGIQSGKRIYEEIGRDWNYIYYRVIFFPDIDNLSDFAEEYIKKPRGEEKPDMYSNPRGQGLKDSNEFFETTSDSLWNERQKDPLWVPDHPPKQEYMYTDSTGKWKIGYYPTKVKELAPFEDMFFILLDDLKTELNQELNDYYDKQIELGWPRTQQQIEVLKLHANAVIRKIQKIIKYQNYMLGFRQSRWDREEYVVDENIIWPEKEK